MTTRRTNQWTWGGNSDFVWRVVRQTQTGLAAVSAHVISTVRHLPMKPKYEKIEELSQTEIETVILRDNPNELLYAVLSAAIYSDDSVWAEDVCIRLAAHEHYNVRGNAILGFGHIARIHEKLDEAKVKPLIESALEDESEYVRGQAEGTKDDVKFFLRWRFKHRKNQPV